MRINIFCRLFIAGLFLFQTVLPVYSSTENNASKAAGVSRSDPTNKLKPVKPSSPVESQEPFTSVDLVYLQVKLLAPVISEMSDALTALHSEYPKQKKLWQKLIETLPDGDPFKVRFEEITGTAGVILLTISRYAEQYEKARNVIEKSIEKDLSSPEQVQILHQVRLLMVLGMQEKIGYYEFLSQRLIEEISTLARLNFGGHRNAPVVEQIESFEKFRKVQVSKYFETRKSYDQISAQLFDIKIITENERCNEIKERVGHYLNLTKVLSHNRPSEQHAVQQAILQLLKRIAGDRSKELLATMAALSEGRQGDTWSMLYAPSQGNRSNEGQDQASMARHLIRSLKAMRPKIIQLAGMLKERNRFLRKISLVNKKEGIWLRIQIDLQDIRIRRLKEVISLLEKRQHGTNSTVENQNMAALWEEFGYIKEDILSLEAIVLYELNILGTDTGLTLTPGWVPIRSLLEKEKQWRAHWVETSLDWQEAVDEFKRYQISLLERYIATLEMLESDIQGIVTRPSSKMDPVIVQLLNLFDTELSERLSGAKQTLASRKAVTIQEASDPMFSYLFGIREERFWHDFRAMGLALNDPEQLIRQKTIIQANIISLTSPEIDSTRKALLILRLAEKIGVTQHIGRDEQGVFVIFASGNKKLVLEGLAGSRSPVLKSLQPHHLSSRSRLSYRRFFTMLLTVPEAHAGQYTRWSNHVFSQMKKNWLGYVVTGVVLVSAVAAAPVVAAAGATAATVTAVSATATGVASGAASAFYAQATADITIGSSRHIVNEIDFGDNNTKKNFNTAIDTAETVYNISKVAEGIRRVVSPGKSVEEVAEQVNKVRQATEASKMSQLQRLQSLKDTAAQLRRQIEAAEEAGGAFKDARKISDLLRDQRHLLKIERLIESVSEEAGRVGNEGAKWIARIKDSNPVNFISSSSRLENQIVEGSGVPNDIKDSIEGITALVKDADGDGTPDVLDLCPGDPKKTSPGKCGCKNLEDIDDSDGDGTINCKDGCPGDPNKIDPGICDCNNPEDIDDSDGDGTINCKDGCPGDPNKIDPGICGCKNPDIDADGNGILDCREQNDNVDNLKNSEDQTSNSPNINHSGGVPNINLSVPDSNSGSWSPTGQSAILAERDNSAQSAHANQMSQIADQGQSVNQNIANASNQHASAESAAQGQRQQSTMIADAIMGGLTSGVAAGVDSFTGTIGVAAGLQATGQTGQKHDNHSVVSSGSNGASTGGGSVPTGDDQNHAMIKTPSNVAPGSGGHPGSHSGDKKKPPKRPPVKPPPIRKPHRTKSPDGCLGGRCCKGHQMYCKRGGTVYRFSRTAIDRNFDGICDICKLPYRTKKGRVTTRSAQVGDVVCRGSAW